MLKKEIGFLTVFGTVCFLLAIFNNYITLPIPNYQFVATFLLDGLFILFSLLLAVGGKDIKVRFNAKFIIVYILSLFVFEIAVSLIGSFLCIMNPLAAVSTELFLKFIITGAVFLILLKIFSKDTKIEGKKIAICLCAGLALLLVLRFIMFRIFESSYYAGFFDPAVGNDYFDLMVMLTPPKSLNIINDIFAFLIPVTFGISALLSNKIFED